jgi:hypothetical protein
MRKLLWIILAVALLGGTPDNGSAQQTGSPGTSTVTQPADIKGPAVQAAAVKTFTPQERQKYEKKMAADLEATQQKIADLRIQAGKVPSQKKRMILSQVRNLQMQVGAARSQLTALEKAADKDWGGLKADLDNTIQSLNKGVEAFERQLN